MRLSGFDLDAVQQRLPTSVQLYVVGGAVRDELLGKTPDDCDWVVVGATPQHMLDAGFVPVGSGFPVFLHPLTHEEYALARTERKQGHGYKGFVFHADPSVTLEEDLARRDFTINAMAKDAQGMMHDPWGGLNDLQQQCLRHVGSAFVEDPLRVLRLARFLARWPHFELHPDTWALCKTIAAQGELAHLVPERILAELQRALCELAPSRAWVLLARLEFWTGAVFSNKAVSYSAVSYSAVLSHNQTLHPWDQPSQQFLQGLDARSTPNSRWLWCAWLLPDEASLECVHQCLKWPADLYQLACVLMRCRAFAQEILSNAWIKCAGQPDLQTDNTVFVLNAEALLGLLHAVDVFRKPGRLHLVLEFLRGIDGSVYAHRLLRVLQMAAHAVEGGEYHRQLRLYLQQSAFGQGPEVHAAQAVQTFKLQWVEAFLA